jgi:phosphoribosylglycinamide formyltransferase-1
MTEQFVGEAIQPVAETFDPRGMSAGGPGLPQQFRWRRKTVQVARMLRSWRETGPCHHGSGESYVRKHWFQIETNSGDTMVIYFERQARSRSGKNRWWLYSMDSETVVPTHPTEPMDSAPRSPARTHLLEDD